jgi:uncharacterized membrane protein (DUF4010 family)
MVVRVFIEVFVVHRALLPALAIPLGAIALVSAGAGVYFYWRGTDRAKDETEDVALQNPFSLTSAAKFGAVFAAVMLAVALAQRLLPPGGMYVVAGLAGLTDVDAITLSMADFARSGGEAGVAVVSITVAALSNTLVKGGMVLALGSRDLKRRVAVVMALVVVAGIAGALVSRALG